MSEFKKLSDAVICLIVDCEQVCKTIHEWGNE